MSDIQNNDTLMSDIAQELYPLYSKSKRDEMTFGYLPEFIPADIVPDMTGSAAFYTPYEIYLKCMEMDAGFVGLRRSTIDKTRMVRQAILYTLIARRASSGNPLFAVYKRSKGSDARLEGNYSLGFGGHVETADLVDHIDGVQGCIAEGCISSFNSTIKSGVREVNEEVALFDLNDRTALQVEHIEPLGFLSDIDVDNPDHVGNTHFCMIGVVAVEETVGFNVTDPKYATVGWMGLDALKAYIKHFEPWSRILIDSLAELVAKMEGISSEPATVVKAVNTERVEVAEGN